MWGPISLLHPHPHLTLSADLATPAQATELYHTLVTILFGTFYDARTTQHDPTAESAWTIAALVPAFCALDPAPYEPVSARKPAGAESILTRDAPLEPLLVPSTPPPSDLATTLTTSYRRALAYPLYRSWALAERCAADVARCLSQGTPPLRLLILI